MNKSAIQYLSLTQEDLIARLSKTGGTPYKCLNVIVEIAPGLILSAATINAMLRRAFLTRSSRLSLTSVKYGT